MLKELLYTTAIDQLGNIVHVDNAEKGLSYYCPMCKREFVLRKSGKSGKGSRRPHFAHNQVAPNCTPEGVLHYSFKKLLIADLKAHQSGNRPVALNWGCRKCGNKYTGNLLENVTSIREEYALEECRPDVALLNEREAVVAVIEIVVSHPPEDSVLQYYLENHIVLVRINLSSEEDLANRERKIANPDVVELCLDAKCPGYTVGKARRELLVGTKFCGACLRPMGASVVRTSHVFGVRDSFDFSEEEVKLAESKGVKFERRFKKTSNEPYQAVICMNCKIMRSRYRRGPRF
jgi:ribosomal protein L37AE/L43A